MLVSAGCPLLVCTVWRRMCAAPARRAYCIMQYWHWSA